jgi:hypothetical protein
MQDRITLVSETVNSISVNISAYFNDQNDLVIEGQDLGEGLGQIIGDTDYEYWLTIPFTELERFASVIGAELFDKDIQPELLKASILQALIRKYSNDSMLVGNLKQLLKQKGIRCEFTTY